MRRFGKLNRSQKFVQFRMYGHVADQKHFIALTGPVDRTNIDTQHEEGQMPRYMAELV
jgi:hypothetical protein